MDSSFLNNTAIPHIRQHLRRADLVLFTGAGFSLTTTNLSGIPLPDGKCLSRLLWDVAYPGDFEKGSSLQDIYEGALRRRRKELERVLRTALTVDTESIDDWIVLYYGQPWHKVYTLNVDSLANAINQKAGLPRVLLPISGTSRLSVPESRPDRTLKVIHLNGTLADLPDGVTFSHTQYAERLATPDQIYQEFAAEFLGRPFIFVGTNIDESPLWQSIEQRRLRGPRGMRENRPRSYLVAPELGLAKRERLEAFNVAWLQMGARDFAERVLKPLADATAEGHDFLATLASAGRSRLQEVGELIAEPSAPSQFLLGAQPLWSDLQSDRAITRLCDRTFYDRATARLKSHGKRGVLAIIGTAGTGKTTSLMALALRLIADGHQVAWVDDTTDVDNGRIVEGMSAANAPNVIALDGVDERFRDSFPYLARRLADLHSNPLILVSVRSGTADTVLDPHLLDSIPCEEHGVPHLADTEIDDLLDVLGRASHLGVLRGKPRTQQRDAFKKQANRQLLVAMIQATSGEKFEDKIDGEYKQLSESAQTIYATVCLASNLGYRLRRQEILQAVPDPSNVELNAFRTLTSRHVLLERPSSSRRYQARHRLVAERLTDRLRVRGQLAPVVEALGRFAARLPITGGRPDDAFRLRRRMISHPFVHANLGVHRGQMFYESVEGDLDHDFHFWLQRGSFELEWGSLRYAERYLAEARGIAPGDHRVRNEWAYLLFRKANMDPSADAAPALVEEATAILKRLMENERASEYPFHVLGSQGLVWSRKGQLGRGQRGPYLRELMMHVEEGIKRFPRKANLKGLLAALKEAYLGIAVSGRSSETGWPGQR